MAASTKNGRVELTIGVNVDAKGGDKVIGALNAHIDRLNKELGSVAESAKSLKTVVASFNNLQKQIAAAVKSMERMQAAGTNVGNSLGASAQSTNKMWVEVVHTLQASLEVIKTMEARTAAIQNKADTARRNVAEQSLQQQFKLQAKTQMEEEKRVTAGLRFEQRKQIENLKQSNSISRIDEQANQQRRLARWQQFYKTVGGATRKFSENLADGAGKGLVRLFTKENADLGKREMIWRRHTTNITNIEAAGERNQLNLFGRFFDRRAAVLNDRLNRESAKMSRRSAGTGAVGAKLNSGLLGGLTSALPIGVGGGFAAVGLGLAAGLGSSLKVASDYTSAMAELGKSTSASAAQMKVLGQQALDLGNDVTLPGVSAKDAADGFRILTNSGIKLQDVIGKKLPSGEWKSAGQAVLQLSRATGTGAEEAAKSIASAINVFGFSGDKAGSVADQLAKATSLSGASLAEFNDAFKQSGIVFASYFKNAQDPAKSFSQLNGLLTVFAKNGLRGESAGQNVKIMLQRLSSPTKAAAGLLKDFTTAAGKSGTVLTDSNGKVRSFGDTLSILRTGINKLPTEAAKLKAVSTIFGARSSLGALKIASISQKDFDSVIKGIDAQGFAAKRAAAKNAGFKGGLDALSSAIETVQIQVGTKLGNAFRTAAVKLSDLVTKVASGTGVWKTIRYVLLGVVGALTALTAVKGLGETISLLRTGFAALTASPLGLLAGAVVAIGGAIGYFISQSPGAVKQLKALGSWFRELTGPTKFVSDLISSVGDVISNLANNVMPTAIVAVQDFIKGLLMPTTDGSGSFFSNLGSSVVTVGKTVFNTIGAIKSVLLSGWRGVQTNRSGIWHIIEMIGTGFRAAVTAAENFTSSVSRIFNSNKSVFAKLGDVFGAIPDALIAGLKMVPTELAKAITHILSGNGSMLTKITDIGTVIGRSLGSEIQKGLSSALGSIDTEFTKTLGKIIGSDASVGSKLGGIVTAIGIPLNDLFAMLPGKLGEGFAKGTSDARKWINQNIVGPVERFFGSISTLWTDAFSKEKNRGVGEGILQLVRGIAERLGRTLTAFVTNPTFLKVVSGLLLAAGTVVVNAVYGFIKGVIEKLIDRIKSAFQSIPIFGGLLAGLAEFAKSLTGIISAALIAGFAVKFLKGPLGEIGSLVSKVFGKKGILTATQSDQLSNAQFSAQRTVQAQITKDRAAAAANKATYTAPSAAERARLVQAETQRQLTAKVGPDASQAILRAESLRRDAEARAKEVQSRRDNLISQGSIRGSITNARDAIGRSTVGSDLVVGRNRAEAAAFLQATNNPGAVSSRARLQDRIAARAVLAPDPTLRQARIQRVFTAASDVGYGAQRGVLQTNVNALESQRTRANSLLNATNGPVRSAAVLRLRADARQLLRDTEPQLNTLKKRLSDLGTTGQTTFGKIGSAATTSATKLSGWLDDRKGLGGISRAITTVTTKFTGLSSVTSSGVKEVGAIGQAFSAVFGKKVPGELGRVEGLFQKAFGSKQIVPITAEIDGQLTKIGETTQRVGGKFQKLFGTGKDGIQNAVQTTMGTLAASVGAFFGGKMIADSSTGLQGKITGVVTALGSIAAATAAGGSVGGGLALMATAWGYISQKADEAVQKQKAFTSAVGTTAETLRVALRQGQTGFDVAAQQTKDFITKNYAELNKFTKQLPGSTVQIRAAITDSLTGKSFSESVDALAKRIRKKFGTETIPITADLDIDTLRDKFVKEFPKLKREFALDKDWTFAMSVFTDKASADKAAAVVRQSIQDGIASGSVDAQHAADKVYTERVGSTFRVIREQVKGLDDDQVQVLNDIFGQISQNTQAVGAQNGELLKGVDAADKQLSDERKKTQEYLNQNDLLNVQRGRYDSIKNAVGDVMDRLNGKGTVAKTVADAANGAKDAVSGVVDALKNGDTKTSLVDALMGGDNKGRDSAVGRAVQSAGDQLQSAWTEIVTSVAADPKNKSQAAWDTAGKLALLQAQKSIMDNAKAKGLSDADQKALIASLKIPEFVDIQPGLKAANDEQIKSVLGDTADKVTQIWNANGPTLQVKIGGLDDAAMARLKAIAAAQGADVVTVGSNTSGPSRSSQMNAGVTPGQRRADANQSGGPVLPPLPAQPAPLGPGHPDANGNFKTVKDFKAYIQHHRPKNMPFKAFDASEPFQRVKFWETFRSLESATAMMKWFEYRGGHIGGYARGGIVRTPTLGVFGEAGPEVILPLSNKKRMLELLMQAFGRTGTPEQLAAVAHMISGRRSTTPMNPKDQARMALEAIRFKSAIEQLRLHGPRPTPVNVAELGPRSQRVNGARGEGRNTTIHEGAIHIYEQASPRATARAVFDERRSSRYRNNLARAN